MGAWRNRGRAGSRNDFTRPRPFGASRRTTLVPKRHFLTARKVPGHRYGDSAPKGEVV